jgi:hypothetical protein
MRRHRLFGVETTGGSDLIAPAQMRRDRGGFGRLVERDAWLEATDHSDDAAPGTRAVLQFFRSEETARCWLNSQNLEKVADDGDARCRLRIAVSGQSKVIGDGEGEVTRHILIRAALPRKLETQVWMRPPVPLALQGKESQALPCDYKGNLMIRFTA